MWLLRRSPGPRRRQCTPRMWPTRAVFRPAGCFRPQTRPWAVADTSSRPETIPTSCAVWRPSITTTTTRPEPTTATSTVFLKITLSNQYWSVFSFSFYLSSQSSMKNPFLEPKMRINQPKSFTDGPLLGSKKSSPITSTQVSQNRTLNFNKTLQNFHSVLSEPVDDWGVFITIYSISPSGT